MKHKYRGMISVIVSLAALVLAGGYFGSGIWVKSGQHGGFRSSGGLQIEVPSERQVHRMQALSQRLAVLAHPVDRATASSTLTLFGYQPPDVADRDGWEASNDFLNAQRGLSLTVAAGTQRFCVIDGVFLTEGDQLPDGSRVLKIESQRVLLALDMQSRWIFFNPDENPVSAEKNKAASAKNGKEQS